MWLQFTAGEIWLHLVGLELNFDLNSHFMENNGNGGELVLMGLLVHRQFSWPSAVPKGLLSCPQEHQDKNESAQWLRLTLSVENQSQTDFSSELKQPRDINNLYACNPDLLVIVGFFLESA